MENIKKETSPVFHTPQRRHFNNLQYCLQVVVNFKFYESFEYAFKIIYCAPFVFNFLRWENNIVSYYFSSETVQHLIMLDWRGVRFRNKNICYDNREKCLKGSRLKTICANWQCSKHIALCLNCFKFLQIFWSYLNKFHPTSSFKSFPVFFFDWKVICGLASIQKSIRV